MALRVVQPGTMEKGGQRLRQIRDRLSLTMREVEAASRRIATRHRNYEFVIGVSRLSEIENRDAVPTVYRLYSLCAIYRLEPSEVLEWYGVHLAGLAADAALIQLTSTHAVRFNSKGQGDAQVPLSLDPGLDLRHTSYLSQMIQRWGKLPLAMLGGIDLKSHRYAFIGTEDWTMYPLLRPGSLVEIDETRHKIAPGGWATEFDRPIYFLEHREGYACGWCSLHGKKLMIQPHPASLCAPRIFGFPEQIEVIGQVTGVAMRLEPAKRRRARSTVVRSVPSDLKGKNRAEILGL